MPKARTGLNTVTRKRPDGTIAETRWYLKASGALIGSTRDGMTRDRALAIARAVAAEPDRAEPRSGSFDWLAARYLASTTHAKKAAATARNYRASLDLMRQRWGLRNVGAVTRSDVTELLTEMAGKRHMANAHVRVLRLVYNWGRRNLGLTCPNPADAPELHATPPRTAIWDEARIAAFLAAAPAELRLAMALMLYTVQRPSDVLAFQRGQVMERAGPDGESRLWLVLRQQKTGEMVAVPCHRNLEVMLRPRLAEMGDGAARAEAGEVVDPVLSTHLLVPRRDGAQWRYRHFAAVWDRTLRRANWTIARATLREWGGLPPRAKRAARAKAKDGLRGRLLIGLQRRDLRRTGMVMLALAGATIPQIAALSGHSVDQTAKIIETYIPRRGEIALAGMELWERGERRAIALLPQGKAGRDGG